MGDGEARREQGRRGVQGVGGRGAAGGDFSGEGTAETGAAVTTCVCTAHGHGMYASYCDCTWSSTNCNCRRYMRASSVGCLTLPAFSSTCSVLCRTCGGAVIAGAASGVGWQWGWQGGQGGRGAGRGARGQRGWHEGGAPRRAACAAASARATRPAVRPPVRLRAAGPPAIRPAAWRLPVRSGGRAWYGCRGQGVTLAEQGSGSGSGSR